MRFLLILLLLIFSLSCFRLRQQEEPSGEEVWVYPDESHKVLDNLKYAYIYRNIENLKTCYDSSNFYFYSDESLLSGPSGDLYRDWDYVKEIEFTSTLFLSVDPQEPSPITFSLFSPDSIDTLINEVKFSIQYEFSVAFNDGSKANARGRSVFLIALQPTGLWAIKEWWDFKDTTLPYLSWAEIKALRNSP